MSHCQIVLRARYMLTIAVAICVVSAAWATGTAERGQQEKQAAGESPVGLRRVGERTPNRSDNFIDILPGTPKQSQREASQAVRKLLRQHIEFNFKDVPVQSLAEFLEESLHCPVMIDKLELQLVGINPETAAFTASYHNIPLDLALRTMLPQLEMGYYIDGSLLVLTSREKVEVQHYTEVYECEGLLRADAVFLRTIMPPKPVKTTEEKAGDSDDVNGANDVFIAQSSGGMCQFDFPNELLIGHTSSDDGPQDRFIDMITSVTGTKDGNGWLDDGTGNGTLNIFAGKLVVSQAEEVHEEIAELLDLMRARLANAASDVH
ncbi:MAG: hypothetical protein MPJ50_03350 [Pirellulales bacterium]|nr:hypothetical protein [Pirellulales bacterium]